MRPRCRSLGLWLIIGVTVVCLFNFFTLLIRLSESSTLFISTEDVTTGAPTERRHGLKESTFNNVVPVTMTTRNTTTKTTRRRTPQIDEFQQKVWASLNESKIGIHIFRPNEKPTTLILIGERHSGTTFLTSHLKECFPGINVDDTFVNGKHWWQPTPDYVVEAASKISDRDEVLLLNSNNGLLSSLWTKIARDQDYEPNDYFHSAVVIAIFRNPYEWVEAMRRKPWHWPNHVDLYPMGTTSNQSFHITQAVHLDPKEGSMVEGHSMGGRFRGGGISVTKSLVGHRLLEWEEFIKRPLTLVGYNENLTLQHVCQKGYPYKAISPCHRNTTFVPESVSGIPRSFLRHLPFEVNDPVYELDFHGEPFDNLLQLRAKKAANFLSIPKSWNLHAFGVIQYDRLIGNNLDILRQQIAGAIKANISCSTLPSFMKQPYNLSGDIREFVKRHSDWKVERQIGFQP